MDGSEFRSMREEFQRQARLCFGKWLPALKFQVNARALSTKCFMFELHVRRNTEAPLTANMIALRGPQRIS